MTRDQSAVLGVTQKNTREWEKSGWVGVVVAKLEFVLLPKWFNYICMSLSRTQMQFTLTLQFVVVLPKLLRVSHQFLYIAQILMTKSFINQRDE